MAAETVEHRGLVSIIRINMANRLNAIRAGVAIPLQGDAPATAETLVESAPLVLAALKRLVTKIMPTGPVERVIHASMALATL